MTTTEKKKNTEIRSWNTQNDVLVSGGDEIVKRKKKKKNNIENLFQLIYVYGRFMGINNLMLF